MSGKPWILVVDSMENIEKLQPKLHEFTPIFATTIQKGKALFSRHSLTLRAVSIGDASRNDEEILSFCQIVGRNFGQGQVVGTCSRQGLRQRQLAAGCTCATEVAGLPALLSRTVLQ